MANPAAKVRARVLAEHPEAVVVERGRNSLKHRCGQRFALDVGIGPFHYEEGSEWHEIDTAFESSIAPWDWEMTKAGFEVRALSRLDAGQVIEYRSAEEYVRFQPMALRYSNDLDQIQPISMPQNLDAVVDDDTLTWTDGYGSGLSFSWQAQTARLAKRLTIQALSDLPTVEQYILDGGNPVLELNFVFAHSKGVTPWINGEPWNKKQRDTQGLVEFKDDDGNILWWFNLPRSWDAEGNRQLGTFRFKKVGNSLYVSHRVPLAFMQSAVYPLTVDVDVDEQPAESADDCWRRLNTSYWDVTADYIAVGFYQVGNQQWGGGMRFPGVVVGAGPTAIDNGKLILTALYDDSGATCNTKIKGEDAATPAIYSTSADFDGRDRTAQEVAWVVPTFSTDTEYASSDITAILQHLVDTYSYTDGGAAMAFFWDDFDDLSDLGAFRYAYSYDEDTGKAAQLHFEYSPPVYDGVVAASTDDACQVETGGMDLTADLVHSVDHFINMGREWAGLRFLPNGGGFPANGMVVTSAYVEIYVEAEAQDDIKVYIHAHDAASPGTFTAGNTDITDRARTTNYATWDALSLGTGWKGSLIDLTDVIQELVDDFTVTAIVLIFKPTATTARWCYFHSCDKGGGNPAKLHLEWTSAAPAAGNVKVISGVAWASVKKVSGVAEASIKKVSGVTAN